MTLKKHSKPPYPVLAASTGDYDAASSYQAAYVVRLLTGDAIAIGVQHRLQSPGLQSLLDAGQASYALYAQCQRTRQRALRLSPEPKQTVTLPDAEYAGRTTIRAMIIAAVDIPRYQASDWSPATRQLLADGIAIPGAALLAAAQRESFDTGNLDPGDSIVQMIPSDYVDEGINRIELDKDKVIMKMPPAMYRQIRDMQANPDLADALWPSIYLPAIQQAVRHHRDEAYQGNRWTSNIRRQLEAKLAELKQSVPDDETLAANDYYYAQLLMNNPIPRLLAIQTYPEDES